VSWELSFEHWVLSTEFWALSFEHWVLSTEIRDVRVEMREKNWIIIINGKS
jgi:hypothetical protein